MPHSNTPQEPSQRVSTTLRSASFTVGVVFLALGTAALSAGYVSQEMSTQAAGLLSIVIGAPCISWAIIRETE